MLAGVDLRGFLVAAPLALKLGLGFIMVRKRGKLPGATIPHEYASAICCKDRERPALPPLTRQLALSEDRSSLCKVRSGRRGRSRSGRDGKGGRKGR